MEQHKSTTNYQPPTTKPTLLVIVGETASGKSALAMEIARKFRGEIISADSWQVYKKFDIGTAKPTQQERLQVRHHLIDVVEPEEGFSAPKFKELAKSAITQAQARSKLPILVGGTGLYIDSLIFDYNFLPRASESERKRLNGMSIDGLLSEARDKNINLQGIDLRNKRRLVRALESGGQKPAKSDFRPGTIIVGLLIDRQKLRQNVELRVKKMFGAGLPGEVEKLATDYGWDIEPMKGIGYKEFQDYFQGSQNLDEVRQRIISNTMNLAKKQRTWFKRNPSIQWFASPAEEYDYIYSILNT